ncbi:NAD(P)H-quinone oxidoreductase subunit H chloroplastic [Bienertia sinuspersici]
MRMMHNYFRIGGDLLNTKNLLHEIQFFYNELRTWALLGEKKQKIGVYRDQCYELPEYNEIFVKLIIMSVMTNLIGKFNGKKKEIR